MLTKRSLKDLFENETCDCILYQTIEKAIWSAQQQSTGFSLAFLDLGHFKEVNACFDYQLADRLLVKVVGRLKKVLEPNESLCHFSGDRFVLLINAGNQQQAIQKAIQLIETLRQTYHVLSRSIKLSVSLGITLYSGEEKNPLTLMREGELALQHAKKKGRNTWSLFNEAMLDSVDLNYQIRNELHFALEKQELWLAYQPLMQVNNFTPVGFETLLRWEKPELGNPPPALFIPPAEENGLIVELGNWVLEQALEQLKSWQTTKQCRKFLSVNISPRQFWEDGFFDGILEKVKEHGINPLQLELEITESTAMHNLDESCRLMKNLKEQGFSIAIDDFGTGYSSLAYLKDLPANKIKIDKHFLLSESKDNQTIIEHIVRLGQALGKQVLAEGVETVEQHSFLKSIACPYAQGFLYGKPMNIKELDIWQKSFWLFPG